MIGHRYFGVFFTILFANTFFLPTFEAAAQTPNTPNILFAMADDWSWPHASAYGTEEVDTPNFDRVAREGILFHNAFVAAPQCSPNRAAFLTGRHIWQLEEAGTHGSLFPKTYPVFTRLLEDVGYHVGYTGKGWAPGNWKDAGWNYNPAGREFNGETLENVPADGIKDIDYAGNFDAFLETRPDDAPFFFLYGAKEPHRRYEQGSGRDAGKNPANVDVPDYLPDHELIRNDFLDYFVEIEWFDRHLGEMLGRLEDLGELENTIVVVTGDNGMPFPRAKANVYEDGIHVPLAIRWPGHINPNQENRELVSFTDFAPTFLDIAGIETPDMVTGKSLLSVLTGSSEKAHRDYVLAGRERHTHARYDNLGYPARAIRTPDYLYIQNFKAGRWPAGAPDGYEDIDGCPTLDFMQAHAEEYPRLWALSVKRRPAHELYALRADPDCVTNLAGAPEHSGTLDDLREQLESLLTEQGDPRMHGKGDIFESYPRFMGMRPHLGGFAERGEYNPKYQVDE